MPNRLAVMRAGCGAAAKSGTEVSRLVRPLEQRCQRVSECPPGLQTPGGPRRAVSGDPRKGGDAPEEDVTVSRSRTCELWLS